MPDAKELHEALGILLPKADPNDLYLAAEHDELYIPGPPPKKLTPEERKRLEELNVTWEGDGERWHAFV